MQRGITLFILSSALALTSCERHELQKVFDSFSVDDVIEDVRVELGSADLYLVGNDENFIEVELDLEYVGSEEPYYKVLLEDGRLTVLVDCAYGCDGVVTVHVPSTVSADLDLGSGEIEILDMEGKVVADSDSGDIKVEGCSGDLELTSSSGDIIGTDLLTLDCGIEADTGDVDLVFLNKPDWLIFRTNSGDVDVTVPQGAYYLDLNTGSGEKILDDIKSKFSSVHRIRIETDSGDIAITGV